MRCYLVGGAVRDNLLGLPVRDRDWVVVGASEADMLARGFKRMDVDFPVFLHPVSGDEYALARRETKTGPGYKGFAIDAGLDVTLEQDLIRRDLTINAMAEDEAGNLIDPFGGRNDLDAGLLRHISPAFVEDPLRLLRVARFAARLGRWGFRVSHSTHKLLKQMAASGELATLPAERIWQEMKQALAEEQPWRFFQVLQSCGALGMLIPQLERVMLRQDGHGADDDSPLVTSLQRAVRMKAEPQVRFCVAFYPAAEMAGDPDRAMAELPVEKEYAELLSLTHRLASLYRQAAAGDAERLLELIERSGALHDASRLAQFLTVADALWPELKAIHDLVLRALKRVKVVTSGPLRQAGLQGVELGQALRLERLKQVNVSLTES